MHRWTRRDVLRLAVLGPTLVGCGANAGSGAGPRASPTGPTTDVRSYGAVGDGATDDTRALQRALAALPQGATLVIPAEHTFLHADVLQVTAAGVTLLGGGALVATAEGTSALQLLAEDVRISDLTLGVAKTTRRWSTPDQHRLYLGPHFGLAVTGVTVTGSAAAGIFSYGAQRFALDHVQVRDTRADGIHLTNGSGDGQLQSPHVSRSGDDGVAVVSYEADGQACHNIDVTSPMIRTTTGGRGLSVVGGHDITYRNINVDRSSAAAVYLACEGEPYNTFPTQRVLVSGGTITRANTDVLIDHGAVLAYCGRSGGEIADLTVAGLHVSGTRTTASRQIGAVSDDDGVVSAVTFADLALAAAPRPYEGNVNTGAVTLHNVLAAGMPVEATA